MLPLRLLAQSNQQPQASSGTNPAAPAVQLVDPDDYSAMLVDYSKMTNVSDQISAAINNAYAHTMRGYLDRAIRENREALRMAKEAGDAAGVATADTELGMTYYRYTGNISRAFGCYSSVVRNTFGSSSKAAISFTDMMDIGRFLYSQGLVRVDYKEEYSEDDETGAPKTFRRLETQLAANRILNSMFPQTLAPIGIFDVRLLYRHTDFLGTRDTRSVFIDRKKIAADPNMPYQIRRLVNRTYPLLQISGVDSLTTSFIWSIYNFDGMWSLPLVSKIIPKFSIGAGYTLTRVGAKIYSDYDLSTATWDFLAGQAPDRSYTTEKGTITSSIDLFGRPTTTDPKAYQRAWYYAVVLGSELSWFSRPVRSVFSLAERDENTPSDSAWGDLSKQRNPIFTSLYSVGLRLNTRRFPKYDDRGRININMRYQWENDPTVNSENGVWETIETSAFRDSLHLSLDWDYEFLLAKEESSDKSTVKVTIPFALGMGIFEKETEESRLPYYFSVTPLGIRYRGFDARYNFSISDNGLHRIRGDGKVEYQAQTHSVSASYRF
jgi:hypothetical protein